MDMKSLPKIIDDQIRKAIEEGAFDDLPGKGKPLALDENPFEDPSWRIENRILRSNGFSLPWIETRKDIERDYKIALDELIRTWHWRTRRIEQGLLGPGLESEWTQAQEIFKSKVMDLNKRIFNYNLEAPLDQFKLRPVNFEKEINRIAAPSAAPSD